MKHSPLRSALSAFLVLLALIPGAVALELEDARWLLETYYVEEISEEILALESLDEILTALGDPYTEYMTEEQLAHFYGNDGAPAPFGMGITSTGYADENGLLISSVFPGSPAALAGLNARDRILSVNGVTLAAGEEFAPFVQQASGNMLALEILPAGGDKTKSLSVQLGNYRIPVSYHELADGTPIITCLSFSNETASAIHDALLTYQALEKPWVIDLTGNPGGTTVSAANAATWFLGGEVVCAYFRDQSGHYSTTTSTWSRPDLTDRPVIVLTNATSASASELFSAAVRDYDLGIGIGGRTYGKGVAQVLFDKSIYPDFFDGDSFKITTYFFFSPNGLSNDTVGVLPALTISGANTKAAGLLLAEAAPAHPDGYARLSLCGYEFFIRLDRAHTPDYQAAFSELLEAIPPGAALHAGQGDDWQEISPQELAQELDLPFVPRAFSDTADSFAHRAITLLASHNLLSGYADGTFRPQDSITRGEFCALMAKILALPAATTPPPFTDVGGEDWYRAAIGAMYEKGLISGYEDGTFRPNGTITGQEMVAVLSNVGAWLTIKGYDTAHTPLAQLADEANQFTDYPDWAKGSALLLDRLEALDLRQHPSEAATRASTAQLLCTFMESIGLLWN